MPNARASINTFSSRSSRLFLDEDTYELFNDNHFKSNQMERMTNEEEEPDATDSFSEDIFAGLTMDETIDETMEGTMEDDQTREDYIPEKYTQKQTSKANKAQYQDVREEYMQKQYLKASKARYQDIREGFLTDEDSTTLGSEMSSLLSTEASWAFPTINNGAPLGCLDDSDLKQQLIDLSTQLGTAVDETNQALARDLEVAAFVEDIQQLQAQVMKDGLDHMKNIDLMEVFRSIYVSKDGVSLGEKPALPSAEGEDSQAQPLAKTKDILDQDNLARWMPDMNDFVIEEGMEMPLLSCAVLCEDAPGEQDEKKETAFTKMFGGSQMGNSSTWKVLPSSSVPAAKPIVVRIRLPDGTMATVSTDTAARLQQCHWV